MIINYQDRLYNPHITILNKETGTMYLVKHYFSKLSARIFKTNGIFFHIMGFVNINQAVCDSSLVGSKSNALDENLSLCKTEM
jgi:hypothetical protein